MWVKFIFIFGDFDHVVKNETRFQDGSIIIGTRHLGDTENANLWYDNNTNTAVQQINQGHSGLSLTRFIPKSIIAENEFIQTKTNMEKHGTHITHGNVISSTMEERGENLNSTYTDDDGISYELFESNTKNKQSERLEFLQNISLTTGSSLKPSSTTKSLEKQSKCYTVDGFQYCTHVSTLQSGDSGGKNKDVLLNIGNGQTTAEVLPNIHFSKSNDICVALPDSPVMLGNPRVIVKTPSTQTSTFEHQRNKDEPCLQQVVPEKTNETQCDGDAKWLSWMEIQFQKIAGYDGLISLDEFEKALGIKKSFFAVRLFELFDKKDSGSIEVKEFMNGLYLLNKGSSADKLKFLFDVYDIDGSGFIDRDELKLVLRSCMVESSLSFGEDNLDALTDLLFESSDADNSGAISFEELKSVLEKYPEITENLTISAAQWLKCQPNTKRKKRISRYMSLTYIHNNLRKVLFLTWYILVSIGLGIYAGLNYRNSNGFIIMARIGGMNLNFNCSFVCVLVLRNSLTYLRGTFMAQILPLDQSVLFHKMVGIMIAVWTVIHTAANLGNAIKWAQEDDDLQLWEILFTTIAKFGLVKGSAILTGWLLDIILMIIIICSMPFVRRRGHFQVFYISHMLYIPFWMLCILHCPNFWKWFVVPGVIFFGEKLFRSKFMKYARYGKTYIEEINLLPSRVCHLVISRPDRFTFQPGDYIFLQIPAIANNEWHPFTISSAPEMEDYIWLHVRSAGNWTNKLYEYFENYDTRIEEVKRRHNNRQKYPKNNDSAGIGEIQTEKCARLKMRRTDTLRRMKEKSKKVKVQCYIDGPYGTATREIYDTEHAVLIGAGIGVTPMASILQSIMYRYKTSKRICPKCDHIWYGETPQDLMKLRKVDFIWINRDQKCFEWFVSLLTQHEIDQAEMDGSRENHLIELHLFMTAAQKENDMKGMGLQIALDLMHKKENKDLITGLKTKTKPGRPDWNQIFQQISEKRKGRVKVFFCGAPALGKTVKEYCSKFNFAFSKENF